MTKEEFRERWGQQWAALIASPMWQDAMTTAESEIGVFRVASISDEDIERHGHLIVKGMQAHSKLELTLTTLAKKEFEFASLDTTYPDQAQEADAEARRLEAAQNQTKKPRKKKPL